MSTREYEAMFLLDNAAATADFEATAAQVDKILEKHGAELVLKEKWDERRLAYEIKGHRRATYYLVYFRAPSSSIVEIDRDVGLNEVILRYLTVALDEPIDDHIKHRADDCEKMAEESRRSSLSGWGDRKGGRDRGERDRSDSDRGERDRPRREAKPDEGAAAAGASAPAEAPVAVATPEPASPEPASPEPASPEPASSEPASPEPASSESAKTDAGTAG